MAKSEPIKSPITPDDRKMMNMVMNYLAKKYNKTEAVILFHDENKQSCDISTFNWNANEDTEVRKKELVNNLVGDRLLYRIFRKRDTFLRLSGFLRLRKTVSYLWMMYQAHRSVNNILKELENNYKRPNSKSHEQKNNP